VSVGIGYEDAIEVFRAFGDSDAVVYNPRGSAAPANEASDRRS
jgi:hypothetical protein